MLVMTPIVLLINGYTKGDWWEAALFALSVAVGLTPEMLPMIVTVDIGQRGSEAVQTEGDRQTSGCHPELWRHGYSVH